MISIPLSEIKKNDVKACLQFEKTALIFSINLSRNRPFMQNKELEVPNTDLPLRHGAIYA